MVTNFTRKEMDTLNALKAGVKHSRLCSDRHFSLLFLRSSKATTAEVAITFPTKINRFSFAEMTGVKAALHFSRRGFFRIFRCLKVRRFCGVGVSVCAVTRGVSGVDVGCVFKERMVFLASHASTSAR